MRGDENNWRGYLHGEHADQYRYEDDMYFLTDGHSKSIWHSQTNQEQLFNLDNDPHELRDLVKSDGGNGVLHTWR